MTNTEQMPLTKFFALDRAHLRSDSNGTFIEHSITLSVSTWDNAGVHRLSVVLRSRSRRVESDCTLSNEVQTLLNNSETESVSDPELDSNESDDRAEAYCVVEHSAAATK